MWNFVTPSLDGMLQPCRIRLEHAPDFIAHPTEDFHLLGLRACGVCWVVEAPVIPTDLPGKHRAHLICFAANGDDRVDGLSEEFFQVLRAVRGIINIDLCQRLDRERMHVARRFAARAGDVDQITRGLPQNPFGEMAATRVAGAKDENSRFHKSEGWGTKRRRNQKATCTSPISAGTST